MPFNVIDHPVGAECGGAQWVVTDEDELAYLVAVILVGRNTHAARILQGTQQHTPLSTTVQIMQSVCDQLVLGQDVNPSHRDALLFEAICWLVASRTAGAFDRISDPHLDPTQHGTDSFRVEFDPATRSLIGAMIYEYKCTTHARRRFKKEVLPAFREYEAGKRDTHLSQLTLSLLGRYELTAEEENHIQDKLINQRPLAFRTALTVKPSPFAANRSLRLFGGYSALSTEIGNRFGDTLPLADIRAWFDKFAHQVCGKVQTLHV